MTKKIKTIHELPDWFNLSRYDKIAELSEYELAEELSLRNEINEQTNTEEQKRMFYDIEDYALTARYPQRGKQDFLTWKLKFRSFQTIFRKGSYSSMAFSEDFIRNEGFSLPPKIKEEADAYSLKMFTLWTTSKLASLDSYTINSTELNEYMSIINHSEDQGIFRPNLPADCDIRLDDLSDKNRSSKVHLTVDLEATDEHICNEFRRVLPILRAHSGTSEPTKKPSETNLKKIVQQRIIPYLDLHLWSQLYDHKITDSVMAMALFPDGRMGEQKIKDTIRPLALAAIEPQFVNTLLEKWKNSEEKRPETISE